MLLAHPRLATSGPNAPASSLDARGHTMHAVRSVALALSRQAMTEPPIALDAYQQLADGFAARVDTKPHNAYYERPATLALLPEVAGQRVLDVGCGPGAYAEWLLDHGARVVALDVSPAMVTHAKQRTKGRADVRVADLGRPLEFLADASFDLVLAPLVLEYVRDWRAALRELHRVLVPGGVLVASVTHPFADFQYFKSNDYFATELVSGDWCGFGGRVRVPSYRRSLQETLAPFGEVGLLIERVVEPLPTQEFAAADPRHYRELMQQPAFLHLRAVRWR